MPFPVVADVIAALSAPVTPALTAGDFITSIRYQIPDPTRDPDTGLQDNPYNPDHDGMRIPKFLLYRWMWDGMRDMSTFIDIAVNDWWAFPAIARQPSYQIDARFYQVEAAFAYQYRCYPLPEPWTIYPSQAIAQPLQYGWHKRGGVMEVFYWPTPDRTDPATALKFDITAGQTEFIINDITNFLPFGWLQIEAELLQYQLLTASDVVPEGVISVSRRGVAGTHATTHRADAVVQHCSLWVKGMRTPTVIIDSTSPLEVPYFCTEPLESFVLSKVFRGPFKDMQEYQANWKQYREQMTMIKNNPTIHGLADGTQQVALYGSNQGNLTLYPGGPFGVILP